MPSQLKINDNSAPLHVGSRALSLFGKMHVKCVTAQFCSLFARKKNLGAFMMCEKDIMGQTLYIKETFIATKKRHLIIKLNI